MMIDANKKMAVVYMKENSIQHKGETERETFLYIPTMWCMVCISDLMV